jgi:Alpha-N-acetylglucosaminidase (NAGLU) tim-barrel domain
MSLYGQIMNGTINPIRALHSSSSLIGFGLAPKGQEGNEVMNDLLLDQAWDTTYQHGDLLPQIGQSLLYGPLHYSGEPLFYLGHSPHFCIQQLRSYI